MARSLTGMFWLLLVLTCTCNLDMIFICPFCREWNLMNSWEMNSSRKVKELQNLCYFLLVACRQYECSSTWCKKPLPLISLFCLFFLNFFPWRVFALTCAPSSHMPLMSLPGKWQLPITTVQANKLLHKLCRWQLEFYQKDPSLPGDYVMFKTQAAAPRGFRPDKTLLLIFERPGKACVNRVHVGN